MMPNFSIAPMVRISHSAQRQIWRLFTKKSLIYSEMISAESLLHPEAQKRLLAYTSSETPLAFQLAGRNPSTLAASCNVISQYTLCNEINLNAGCPSPRVQKGSFGLALMREPQLIFEILSAMKEASNNTPISLKCRIGIQNNAQNNPDHHTDLLYKTLEAAQKAGCKKIIIHARPGILAKISPKKNRSIPKINYNAVIHAALSFPNLNITLNGGITNLQELVHCSNTIKNTPNINNIMIGRMARDNPLTLLSLDNNLAPPCPNTIKSALLNVLNLINITPNPQKQKFMIPLSRLIRSVHGAKTLRCLINDPSILWNTKYQTIHNHLELKTPSNSTANIAPRVTACHTF